MYGLVSLSGLIRARRDRWAKPLRERVGRTVLLLGTCSLLTDISSEMVSAILPLYLVVTLGFSPLQFGVVDGLYQGASAFVRLGAGFLGDRMRRYKPVAVAGYGLSAAAKLGLATVGNAFGGLTSIILVDRVGKGIRTAPRDAMISVSAPPQNLGLAFGVHRAMDSAGAMLGPIVAFALLAAAPAAFRTLFLVSFLIALLGFAVITLLVDEPAKREPIPAERPDLRAAAHLMRGGAFRSLTITASVLGLATISDAFVYLLLLEHIDFQASLFPLLATGTAAVYMLLAAPAGGLADRWGRERVFLAGYALLLVVYGLLLLPGLGAAGLVAILILLGGYYAASDGVLAALGSADLPEALRGSGLALLGTTTGLTRLLGSVVFGALWTAAGMQAAVAVFAAGLVAAMLIATWKLRPVHV
jgi:MFS family permease